MKLQNMLPWRRRALERDMQEELAALDEMQEHRGELGNLVNAAEDARAAWGYTALEQLAADLRYALRTMRRSPLFTATAILSLALGIGANTAIFSLMNAILLKSLPVNDPQSLVVLASYSKNDRVGDFGYQDYRAIRDGNHVFSGVLAVSSLEPVEAAIGALPTTAQRKIVTSNYFSVLGVEPSAGRSFTKEEELEPVAVVSNRFWRNNLGASPATVGSEMILDGVGVTIVGVAPPDFLGETVGESPDVWATVGLRPAARREEAGVTWLNLMARLKPGVDASAARADLAVLMPQIPAGASNGGFMERIAVEPGAGGGAGLRDTFGVPLRILMMVAAVALGIACANLASLLLSRAATRQREIATRLALGASRGRIVRQLLTESVLLAGIGGVVGLLFAVWSERLLLHLVSGVGRSITVDLAPDVRVLAFTAAASLLTGLLFGLAPALQAVRAGIGAGLKSTRTPGARTRRWKLKDGLIALQIALSMLLLVTGGLFVRTIENLRDQDFGFRPAHVLSVKIAAQRGYKPDWTTVIAQVQRRMTAIPGVEAASVSFIGTLAPDGAGVAGLRFEGLPESQNGERARANWVSAMYFRTSGIALVEGREFAATDNAAAPRVAIINESLRRRAPGRSFEFNHQRYEIIGVAKNSNYSDLRQPSAPIVYFAALQNGSEIHALELRTSGPPLAASAAVREALREVDPGLRVAEITTLELRVDQRLAPEFLLVSLTGFFSSLTLLLVGIGIYGTLAYRVAMRTSEIGIRMALGARAGAVVAAVLRDILWVIAIGLLAGIAASLAVGRLIASILYGLTPSDPTTIAFAALTLGAAALAAGYIPARRASRIDPVVALRCE